MNTKRDTYCHRCGGELRGIPAVRWDASGLGMCERCSAAFEHFVKERELTRESLMRELRNAKHTSTPTQ